MVIKIKLGKLHLLAFTVSYELSLSIFAASFWLHKNAAVTVFFLLISLENETVSVFNSIEDS